MGKHQPAILGGVLIGVLSALPVVNWVNICCCLWVVVGGALVVYLQQQRTPLPVETSDGVIGGLIAGLVGAVIFTLLNAAIMAMTGVVMEEQLRQAFENAPDMPPEARDMMLRLFSGGSVFILTMLIMLPIYAVFSMLGALLGLAIFRKKTPPPASPEPEVLQG